MPGASFDTMDPHNLKPRVKYTGSNRFVEVEEPGTSLLELSRVHRIPHLHECGGQGICTTCRIRVLKGSESLSPRSSLEEEMATRRGWDPSIRLACQAKVNGDVEIQRLIWTSAETSQLQVEKFRRTKGEERHLVILFCDMRNFTTMADKHPNFDLAHMLNRFFTALGDPILMNDGIIYQYVGDEIVALFGTTGDHQEKDCMDAVRAALGMQYAVGRLNRFEMKQFGIEFEVGIGIHFGKAYVGYIGHPQNQQFSVIGDPVNIASRIQGQNKDLNTKLLISDAVLNQLPENTLKIGLESRVNLKGKEGSFLLHEVLGFSQMDVNLEVQASLELLLKEGDRFAKTFYQNLFDKTPRLRELFKNNMQQQERMLTHMVGGIVYSLSRPHFLSQGLKKLGRDHERYGVQPEHYPLVKSAFLETIQEELGEDCNPEILEAWNTALDVVTNFMRSHKSKGRH